MRPSKKCKDFMKNFPKNFDPIFGVAVAFAVAVGQTARRGMVYHINKNFSIKIFVSFKNFHVEIKCCKSRVFALKLDKKFTSLLY